MDNNHYLLFTFFLGVAGFFFGRYSATSFKNSEMKKNISLNYLKGIDFLLNNQEDKALKEFINAAKINSDNAEIYLSLGNLFREKGDFERSIRLHQGILVRDDLDIEIKKITLLNLAKDFKYAGFYERAVNTLDEFETLDKKNIDSIYEKIKIFIIKKDWDNAILSYKRLKEYTNVDLANFSSIYVEIARQNILDLQFFYAKINLKKAMKIDSQNYYAYFTLGEYYLKKGKYDKAFEYYKIALNLNPFVILKVRTRLNIIGKTIPEITVQESFILNIYLIRDMIKGKMYDEALNFTEKKILDSPDKSLYQTIFTMLILLKSGNYNLAKIIRKNLKLEFQCRECHNIFNTFYWHCPCCKNWLTLDYLD